ncbi:MAG: glucosaminidase domain-containing protein [Chitinophagaceae bacterium]|nr:glucosaminidase domain-containing protein [Chitinophagaceae bacterium]
MKHKLTCVFILWLTIGTGKYSLAQQPEVIQAYIDSYCMLAVAEQKRTGVPAAIKLAQAIHESGGGTGALCKKSNNHFGIKCKSWWKGATAYHDDDAKGECFRAYPTVEESFRDHSDFLKAGPHYAFLFKLPPTDYKAWANGLKQAGYATNDKYPQALIKIIETYNLGAYTIFALNDSATQKPVDQLTEK